MISSGVKFRHLQCFLAVAQQRSLQKAAVVLSITQPAVSKTIKELEELLQVRLFERGRKSTKLTREAEIFFRYAAASVSAMQQAVDSMTRVRNHTNVVISIGVLPTLAPSFMPQVLLAFHQRVTNIQVSLLTGTNAQMLAELRDRKVDLALGRHSDPKRMVGLSFEHLYADPLVLVVRPGHPLLDNSVADVSQLRRYPALLPMKGSFIRHDADAFAFAEGIGPVTDFIETFSVSFSRTYTNRSNAIWFVPWSAVTHDVETGFLVKLSYPSKAAEEFSGQRMRTIGLMSRTDSLPTPEIQILINIIREVAYERHTESLTHAL
ncbi:MAG: Transcriptional regulator, LysR family [Herminiimonas sp.]|nr:Transcriptional regulator, LysR family [Herminiimonas sp.]